MTFLRLDRKTRPLIWFISALCLFLAIGVAVTIMWQRALLINQLNRHLDREAWMLEAVIADDLLTYNYAGIKQYLTVYGSRSEHTISLRVVGDNGIVIAEYTSPEQTTRSFKRTYAVNQSSFPAVVIELTHDVEPLHQAVISLVWKNISAAVLFAIGMSLFLWKVLKRTAFIPLEKALQELHNVNSNLEDMVASRTAQWMRANTELQKEIAEREAAQRELVIKDRAIETAFSGISFAGLDGNMAYVNESWVSLWGYDTPGQILSLQAGDLWQSPAELDQILKQLRLTDAWSGELVARRRDGTFFDVQVVADVVRDRSGKPLCLMTSAVDITERKRAAKELAQSEAKHRMVVENINEIVYIVSVSPKGLQEKMEFVGGRVFEIVGYSAEEFVRDPLLWFSLIHPEDLPFLTASTRQMARDSIEATRVYRVRARNGQNDLWLEDKIVPQFGPTGNVVGYFGVARDISRRKQAEDALKQALASAEEEKNKSEAIIAALGDGISIQDKDFRVLYQNASHSDIIGSHQGKFCYQAYEKRDDVCPGCPVAASFSDGKVHRTERSGQTETGPVYVEVIASPLRNASGEIVAGIELVRDITGQKKAEEEVRRGYETQYVINGLLRVSLAGQSLEEVLLQSLEYILSSSWYRSHSKGAIFLKDEAGELALKVRSGFDPAVHDACARVASGQCLCGLAFQTGQIQFASHIDGRHMARPGEMQPHGHYCVPISVSSKCLGVLSLWLEDGHPEDGYEREFLTAVGNALAGIIRRKQMETDQEIMIRELQELLQKVSASRQEWQETFDSITDMISIHEEDYTIIKANKAFAAQFGLDPREVLQKKCYELVHGQPSPVLGCPHGKTLASGQSVTEEIADIRTGKTYLISTFPFHSSESNKSGIVHVARDITQTRENEMRLMMSERLAALGKMASGIAHEINNPLAAIAGCVDGMSRRISKGQFDPELFTKYLGIMKEEVSRSKNITTSMLSVVQTKDYQKKRIAVQETINKTLEIIGYQGRLKKVEVVKKFSDTATVVHGREGELKQVLLIILTNALDAMEDQGMLTVETFQQDRMLHVAISDTGPGILPENYARLFDPFYTTKSEFGGTGLGLSIASRIIAAHEGFIRVTSSPDSGATFTIELPVSSE